MEEIYGRVLEDKITAAPVLTVLHSSHLSPPLKLGESKTTLGSDSSQAHPSYAQQFLSINFSHCVSQRQICGLAAACQYQQVSHAWFKSHYEYKPSKSDCQ